LRFQDTVHAFEDIRDAGWRDGMPRSFGLRDSHLSSLKPFLSADFGSIQDLPNEINADIFSMMWIRD
jgi:hypothetical protein